MKLKYIIALVLFVGNLMVLFFEQQIRNMSRGDMLSGRQRILVKINGICIGILLVFMILFVAAVVFL